MASRDEQPVLLKRESALLGLAWLQHPCFETSFANWVLEAADTARFSVFSSFLEYLQASGAALMVVSYLICIFID